MLKLKASNKIIWNKIGQIYVIILKENKFPSTKTCIRGTFYLKMEISQSQEWFGNAMKKQTPAVNHTAATITILILETV